MDFAFDIYDSDKNGRIDKKELMQIVTALYDLEDHPSAKVDAKARVEEILSQYDLDKNKSLTKSEFINFITSDSKCSRAFINI